MSRFFASRFGWSVSEAPKWQRATNLIPNHPGHLLKTHGVSIDIASQASSKQGASAHEHADTTKQNSKENPADIVSTKEWKHSPANQTQERTPIANSQQKTIPNKQTTQNCCKNHSQKSKRNYQKNTAKTYIKKKLERQTPKNQHQKNSQKPKIQAKTWRRPNLSEISPFRSELHSGLGFAQQCGARAYTGSQGVKSCGCFFSLWSPGPTCSNGFWRSICLLLNSKDTEGSLLFKRLTHL